MFEASIDGFGGAACGVGMIEGGQDVCGSTFEHFPSVMSAVRPLGTRVEVSVLISASIKALPALVSGAR